MTPDEILNDSTRDGIDLTITEEGKIRYQGPRYALAYWLPRIAKHREAVVEALRAKQGIDPKFTYCDSYAYARGMDRQASETVANSEYFGCTAEIASASDNQLARLSDDQSLRTYKTAYKSTLKNGAAQ